MEHMFLLNRESIYLGILQSSIDSECCSSSYIYQDTDNPKYESPLPEYTTIDHEINDQYRLADEESGFMPVYRDNLKAEGWFYGNISKGDYFNKRSSLVDRFNYAI